ERHGAEGACAVSRPAAARSLSAVCRTATHLAHSARAAGWQAPCRAPRTLEPHDVAAIRTRARAGAERAARMLCQRLRWNFCIDRHLITHRREAGRLLLFPQGESSRIRPDRDFRM